MVLAAHEALTNALTHSGAVEPVSLSAGRQDGHVTVEIVDAGTWAPPVDDHGWGLLIMRRATTTATIETNEHGTRVTLTQSLTPDALPNPSQEPFAARRLGPRRGQ